jgi:DMSO/TMAO reductase YedYZ molybdopterin-dependent catalytic subunit
LIEMTRSLRVTRRQIVLGAVGASVPHALFGCSDSGTPSEPPPASNPPSAGCDSAFADGTMLGLVPFTNEDGPLDTATGSGLNGRLFTDLSKLDPAHLTTPTETYYIRTRKPDLLDLAAPWKISVGGLVKSPTDLTLDALVSKTKPALGPYVMECSGNGAFAAFGMLSSAVWSGVPMSDVLALAEPLPRATRVLVSGFDKYSQDQPGISTPGASWIFTFADLETSGAFLATGINGGPLPPDHGFPVRLMLPNWYGCTCIKWVDTITLVDDAAAATSQMTEFAARTHQNGVPALARDYKPATIDQAAMPVRIEKWSVNGALVYRVVGIMWGGDRPTDALTIRFNDDEPYVHVDVCPKQAVNTTWTLWSHAWRPPRVGPYAIRLAIADPTIRTRRLDSGFYKRTTTIVEI